MTTFEEINGFHYKIEYVRFEVPYAPPYKQIPADRREATNQLERRTRLREEAAKALEDALVEPPIDDKICLSITYGRVTGRADAANIIGGIADAMEGLVYLNDLQVREVHYIEEPADVEGYSVTVSIP